jgi:hypothetical protein
MVVCSVRPKKNPAKHNSPHPLFGVLGGGEAGDGREAGMKNLQQELKERLRRKTDEEIDRMRKHNTEARIDKAKKEPTVPFCPVIGRVSVDELTILRGLERISSELGSMRQALVEIIMKRHIIDSEAHGVSVEMTVDLNTGEIRRKA